MTQIRLPNPSRATLASLPFILCVACAISHERGGGSPHTRWTTCSDALASGSNGDSCSFSDSCAEGSACGCGTSATCAGGSLQLDRFCASCDAGVAWTSCNDALASGSTGDPCSFSGSCAGGPACGCGSSISCVGGSLEVAQVCRDCVGPDAGMAQWKTCDIFRTSGGQPGDTCDPATFEHCSDGVGCCNAYECGPDGTVVTVGPFCASICMEHQDFCPGTDPGSGPPCRSSVDCGGAPICLPPGVSPGCGVCRMPVQECTADSDCASGDVCVSAVLDCSCTPEPSTTCQPSCSPGSCASGESCDASGHCLPISCTDGYTCGSNTTCTPGDPSADDHGCVRRTCTMDADCECGACVNGLCYDGPGACTYPPP